MEVIHTRREVPLALPRSTAGARLTIALDHALLYGLCAVLMFGPLAFGAVEEWAQFVQQVGAAALLALWVLRQAIAGRLRITGAAIYFPVLVFAAVVGSQLLLHTTAVRRVTTLATIQYATYGILLLLAANCVTDEKQRKACIYVFSGFGLALALFAILQDLDSNHKLYWIRETQNTRAIYGPYVNRSHYAGLMEMLTPFPIVALLQAGVGGGKRLILAFAAILMGSSIFLSLSRGGMVAFAAELLLLVFILGMARRQKWAAAVIIASLAGMFLFITWYGAGHVLDRMSSLQSIDESRSIRVAIIKDSVGMVKQRPWTGWGLGTFPDVYPGFRSFYTDKWVNAAHNDYVQVAVETGLLGLSATLAFIALVFVGAVRNLKLTVSHYSQVVVLSSLVGFTGILVHSFIDFNLQIPANAALFFVLGALASVPVSGNAGKPVPLTVRRKRRSSANGHSHLLDGLERE